MSRWSCLISKYASTEVEPGLWQTRKTFSLYVEIEAETSLAALHALLAQPDLPDNLLLSDIYLREIYEPRAVA
jgi:hypothetical protein